MFETRVPFILSVVLLFWICSNSCAFSEFNVKYMKYEALNGHTCPENFTIFDNNSSRSHVSCASKCSRNSSCYGIFHNPNAKRCIECQKRFLINESAPSLGGTNYFMRQTHKLVENKTAWNESKKVCEDLGGYLAEITTEEEEDFVESHLLSGFNLPVWIGGRNNGPMGEYLWSDGTAVSDTFTKWYPGYPTINATVDLCVVVSNHEDVEWTWRVKSCGVLRYTLCEFY